MKYPSNNTDIAIRSNTLSSFVVIVFRRVQKGIQTTNKNTNKNNKVMFWACLKGWNLFRISSKVTE